ncbi:MAG: PAS domain-containing protein, partial [Bacteroidota bacterium]|nr:PAS domain-containing protein [Bacteroidota bacterium]
MTTKRRLYTYFAIFLLFVGVLAFSALSYRNLQLSKFDTYTNKIVPDAINAIRLHNELYHAHYLIEKYSYSWCESCEKEVKKSLDSLNDLLSKDVLYEEAGGYELSIALEKIVSSYVIYAKQYIDISKQGDGSEIGADLLQKMNSDILRFAVVAEPYVNHSVNRADKLSEQFYSAIEHGSLLGIIFLFALMILSVFSVFLIMKSLALKLALFNRYLSLVGSGEFNLIKDKKLFSSKDEFSKVSNVFNKMVLDLKRITVSRDKLEEEIVKRSIVENQLKKSEAQLKLFLDSTNDLVFLKDEKMRYLIVNKSLKNVYGKENNEIIGKTDSEIYSPEYISEWWEETDREVLEFNKTVVKEEITDDFALISTKFPVYLPNGKTGVGCFVRDITELKKIEEELRKNEQRLITLNKSKDKFFSIIAHDLKNPFSNILNLSTLLQEDFNDNEPDDNVEMITMIHDEVGRTFSLLQNLLDWSRSQTGRMDFDPENINISDVAIREVDLLTMQAKNKGVILSNTIKENQFAFADRNMISTVIRNLISNAIKFTDKGAIEL